MNRIDRLYHQCVKSAVTAHLFLRGMRMETVEKVLEMYQ